MQYVYQKLEELKIEYENHDHPAVFTSEEASKYWKDIKGAHCKNLFLRNNKGNQHYLVVVGFHKQVQLKTMEKTIGATRLSFASEKRLDKYLKIKPGSVSPFGLINDVENHVQVILDAELEKAEFVNFHPNINTNTLTISINAFKKFLDWSGNEYRFLEL